MTSQIVFDSKKININEVDMISLRVNAQKGIVKYYLSVFTGEKGKIDVSDAANYNKVIGYLKIVDKKLKMAGQNNFVFLDKCIVNVDNVKKFNYVPADSVGRSYISVKFRDDKCAFIYDGFVEKYASELAERYKTKAWDYKLSKNIVKDEYSCIHIDLNGEEMQ